MDAVSGNISAVYIVRAINERVSNLEYSMMRAKEKIDYIHEEELEKLVTNIPTLEEQLERIQQTVNTLSPMLETADGIDVVIEGQLKTAKDRVQQLKQQLSEARESQKNGEEMVRANISSLRPYWDQSNHKNIINRRKPQFQG
jgi:chromosome segregation ATPase